MSVAQSLSKSTAKAPEKSLQALLEEAQAENQRLKEALEKRNQVSLKVSEKGALSVYGLGRFPVTLYKGQWERLLSQAERIQAFIAANPTLKEKE